MADTASLSAADAEQIWKWNQRSTESMALCVHDILARQAELTPDRPALCSWDGNMTYRELDQASTRLGHYLSKKFGLRVEDVVAFTFEKSLYAIVAMIAVMKAGGILMPLDPRLPQSRWQHAMETFAARMVVSSPSLAYRIHADYSNKMLIVDHSLVATIPESPPNQPCSDVRPENGMLLTFTSGSTGKPKGILQEHDAFSTSCRDHGAAMLITAESRTYQFAGYSFDTSLSDMFCTFLVGGCACLPSDTDRVNNLAGSIEALGANFACLTPSAVEALVPDEVPTLKVLALGGETLTERLVERWASRVTLINVYGVTECIVWCIATEAIHSGDNPSNIGRAVCGRTWIADSDDHTKLAPIGAVGELLIEGPNMARHYHQDQVATQKAFVEMPAFFEDGMRRYYRTGDFVKYCRDGTIDYVGRRDTQIKLAGQRIDLGHIEHCMRKCVPPSVEVCVVVASQRRVLVGFVCAQSKRPSKPGWTIAEVKNRLVELLPSYMVPGAIFDLGRMPSTPTGKVDRRRLSDMALELIMGNGEASERLIGPLTEMEARLQDLCISALGVPPELLGANANFFQLGDSISAMKLANLARNAGLILEVSTIFSHPVLADMAAHISHVSPEIVEGNVEEPFDLFDEVAPPDSLPDAVAAAALQCGTSTEAVEDVYPCTPLQAGLMALSIKDQGAYVAQHVLKLKPLVDLERFQAAWEMVIAANPILRTRLVQFNNQIVQVVLREKVEWLSAENVTSYIDKDGQKPMPFGDRLIRLALVPYDGSTDFVFTAHHSIYDGWSIPLILAQVEQAYRGQFSPPTLSFKSFIRSLAKADREASEKYWSSQLQNAQSLTFPPIPATSRQPRADSVVTHGFSFMKPLRTDITTSTFFRAAWAILISQHCLTDDIVLGTTLSGRTLPLPGINGLVGPTITTVPVRVRLVQSQMVVDYLRQLQDQATEMIQHEHFGLRNIRRLGVDADAACGFQTLLVIQPPTRAPSGAIFADEDELQAIEEIRTFVLTLQVRFEGTEARLTANYDETMIHGNYVTWMLYQMEHILNQLYENPFSLLQDIKAFGPRDAEQVSEWTGDLEFVDRCVHEVFMDCAREMPDACAVLAWDGELSYAALDELSSRLAWHIAGLEIGPEDAVPIIFEKSLWTQVALLGAIKAGATFVLLDPDHPLSRLQGIVEDVDAKLILSSVQYSDVAKSLGVRVLTVSGSMVEGLPRTSGLPPSGVNSRNSLYIHFSSGTTGKPKGSIIEHCSYASSASGTCRALDLNSGPDSANRVLHFAAHSYDQSIGEMLAPIMHGGTICIPSDFERNNDIIGSINKYNCTRATFTPSFGRLVQPSDVPCLRLVVIGGEAMAEQDVEHWKGVQLFNGYGPSETVVCGAAKRSPGINGDDYRSIGHPIDCAHYYIVEPSSHHHRTPLGGLGELVIDSPTVARHYLKEPAKTQQAFVDRPAWLPGDGIPAGRKLYKTGDIARYSHNGEIIFIGRRDTQVKLRSQRLELAEVDYHISRLLPSSAEVIAEVITIGTSKNPILAAFVRLEQTEGEGLLDTDTAASPEWVALHDNVETQLGKVVPGYMIPSAYIPIRRIPFTNSHKVDRKQLRSLAANLTAEHLSAFSSGAGGKKAPTNGLETQMRAQWATILRIEAENISIDDNFFRLGGDSIDAMKLVAVVRSQGFSLTMGTVFQYPRLADMCMTLTSVSTVRGDEVPPFALLESQEVEGLRYEASIQCRISKDLIEDIYPCTPLQQGLLAVSMKKPGMEMAQMSFALADSVSVDRFKSAWEAVVGRNSIMRTRMISTKSGAFQVVTSELIQWLSSKDMQAYIEHDRQKPMVNGDKLSRFALVEDESGRTRFCLTMHHALYDGWAWGLLINQVEDAYAGEALTQPPAFNQFVHFLHTQTQDSFKAVKDYWSDTLADVNADVFPRLPSAVYFPKANDFLQRNVEVTNAGSPTITISNMIRAAWALVVSTYTANGDVVFGSTVTGRNVPVEGIQQMLGPTFATVPLRIQLDPTETIDDYLERLQTQFGTMDRFENFGLQNIRDINQATESACSFQNMLVVQPDTVRTRKEGILTERQDLDEMSVFNSYGLMFECVPSEKGIMINASFDSTLIGRVQMRRIVDQFGHVLRQLIHGGKRMLRDVDMVSPEDYSEITAWNHTPPPLFDECIHYAIESRVVERPDAEAVCSWDGSLTYRELSELSSRLAAHLLTLGAKPNMAIPVCFNKSKWTIVAVMAVMKSGAAFVLLDPAHHPTEKLLELARDVDASILIGSPDHVDTFKSHIGCVVALSQTYVEGLANDISLQEQACTPDDTLCFMFTSGSTGKSKCIVHSHSGLYASFKAFGPAMNLTSDTRLFQFAAYAFDVSVEDILATLMHGGCICIPSESDRINDFTGAFRRLNANHVHVTPSLGRNLYPEQLPGLRTLMLGGEVLLQTEVKRWSKKVHLLSAYGPAESSLSVSGPMVEGVRTPPNLGWPVGCRTWVVDFSDYTKLAPIGVVGQLVIEGPMVAAGGYLNDPVRTAASFLMEQHIWINEVASPQNQRMHKTGDLVRYSADGSLEFVERGDTQIKLRGQRVEVAEVESALREVLAAEGFHGDCAIAKISPTEDTSLLAAFLCTDEKNGEYLQELLSSIADRLSGKLLPYMIPTVIIPIEKMPRMTSTKVDRKMLVHLGSQLSKDEIASYTRRSRIGQAPTTGPEKKLCSVVARILGIPEEQVFADDMFARLGGDSIQGMRLVALAGEEGLVFTVADLFSSPSISALAASSTPTQYPEKPAKTSRRSFSCDFSRSFLFAAIARKYDLDADRIQDAYPCTPFQQGLMSLSLERHGAYLSYNIFDLPKDLDMEKFRDAWAQVVAKNDILRTRILQLLDRTVQVVLKDGVEWIFGSSLDDALKEERDLGVSLGGPLNRFRLIHQEPEKNNFLLWTAHHTTYDGWSMKLVIEQVEASYLGRHVPTGPSFKGFVTELESTNKRSGDFWKDRFKTFEPAVFPIPPYPGYRPNVTSFETSRVNLQMKNASRITASTIIRAAWALLLREYCEEEGDILFGTVSSGRSGSLLGVDRIVGPTMCTVPVAVKVDESETVGELLNTVQTEWLQALSHEHFGLQNISRLDNKCKAACEFQNLLVIQPKELRDAVESNVTGAWLESERESGFFSYPLTFQCSLEDSGCDILVGYDDHLLDTCQVKWLMRQFNHVLQQLSTRRPSQTVAEISLICPEDWQDLENWNNDCRKIQAPDVPDNRICVTDRITKQVYAQPDRPAICSYDGDFTYHDVDAYSDRLACHLVELGIGHEVLVPICFEKSAWTVIAVLAILKAGGGFVPMDAGYPRTWLQDVVQATDASIILASPKTSKLCSGIAEQVVEVSPSLFESLAPTSSFGSRAELQCTACVIFTSGSTGKPKGVVTEHGALSRSVTDHGHALKFGPDSRVLNFASYVFDASVAEMITTLTHGGCICVPSPTERANNIAAAMARMETNWALFTPSFARTLTPEKVPHLKTLAVGGEASGADILATWANKLCLIDAYGPAECCIISTVAELKVDDHPSLIGRAVSGSCWIVHHRDHDRLAALGTVGELVVEAVTVARGYLNDPEKTDDVFITDPKWARAGTRPRRMYKTGDLVRYNSDGTLAYIGRKDTQVKMRGQRMELGPVENLIKQEMSDLTHVTVEQIRLPGGNTQLLSAFLVFGWAGPAKEATEKALSISEELRKGLLALQEKLASSLPPHMVPSMYIPLVEMPLTVSGKTDRKELRRFASELSREQITQFSLTGTEKQLPSTAMERSLQKIWADVLGIPTEMIGVDDGFFQLGGDSIGAMRLATLARESGITITVETIFRNTKLRSMAAVAANTLFAGAEEGPEPFASVGAPLEGIFEELETRHGIRRDRIEDAYPCSPLQQGILALSAKQPGTYVAQSAFRLHPFLDPQHFKNVWQRLVQKHAILRTVIVDSLGAGPLQLVMRDHDIVWQTHSNLDGYLEDDRRSPIDPQTSLARYCIILDDQGDQYFVWTIHHAIYDGWSMGLLLEDLKLFYRGSETSPTTQNPSYAGFASYLSRLDITAAEKFWKAQLSTTALATFPQVQQRELSLTNASLALPASISRRPGSNITTSTLVRAAWAILLARYANSEAVVFGETLSGRNVSVPGISHMVGPTITTVPVAVCLDWQQSVGEYLSTVQAQTTDIIPFQHLGLQRIKLLSESAKEACNFQCLLVIQPEYVAESQEASFWSQEDSAASEGGGFLNYPLVLECHLTKDGVELVALYDSKYLQPAEVQRMLYQLEHILRQLNKESTDQSVGDLESLSPQDKQTLSKWNSAVPEQLSGCIHEFFSKQALSRPDAPAICSWDKQLSYAELDELSDRLAHHLRSLGVQANVHVPVLFEKSCWATVAMLSVLKAGGAYVPLDPKHPTERSQFIIREVAADLMLVGQSCQNRLDSAVKNVFVVDEPSIRNLPAPSSSVSHGSSVDTAFIIFTSGSTGTPKGIIMQHQAFCSSSHSFAAALHLNNRSRVLQFAGYIFDASLAEIFTTLMCGGCICVPREEDRLNRLAEAATELEANWTFLTPTIASLLDPDSIPTLKVLVLGGEKLNKDVVKTWANKVTLINGYGPAECAVWTTHSSRLSADSDPYYLGYHLANRLWIADAADHGQLAPIGCVGELLVEGPCLAKGYLNDTQKTAEVFIDAPKWLDAFSGRMEMNKRMYKTGDLVRYNPDGSITIIGRKDSQVKIYGQRVEMVEIETRMRKVLGESWIAMVEMVHLGDGESVPRLTAFLCPLGDDTDAASPPEILPMSDTARETITSLKKGLHASLPLYMVPSAYIFVRNVPLTAGGKVDRMMLRSMASRVSADLYLPSTHGGSTLKPSTQAEIQLQGLWSTVLKIDPASVDTESSFMELGGDSISAMRLASLAHAEGVALTVQQIFAFPQLSDMAAVVHSRRESKTVAEEAFSTLDVIDTGTFLQDVVRPATGNTADDIEDVLVGTDYQAWVLASGHLRTRGYNNYLIFDLHGQLDANRLHQACQRLIQRHSILRTVFIAHNRQLFQVVLKSLPADVEYCSHVDRIKIIEQDMERAVELGKSPIKFIMTSHGAKKNSLIIRISHAQYDGMCLPIVLQDLQSAYFGTEFASSMPFSRFVHVSQGRMRNSPEAETYWRDLLQGSKMTEIASNHSPSYRNVVNASKTRLICPSMQFLRQTGVTFATVIKAAWAIVLSELSSNSDIIFGHVTSGRNNQSDGFQTIVGPCMNILPVRTTVSLPTTGLELVRQVQEQYLASMAFEQCGFRRIISQCTDWPRWTRFSSILQHTNLDWKPTEPSRNGDVEWRFDNYTPAHDVADIWLWSEPRGDGFWIDLNFSERAIPDQLADQMLELLCSRIEAICQDPSASLGSTGLSPKLPVSVGVSSPPLTPSVNSLPDAEQLVDEAWHTVLGGSTDEYGVDTPFFDVWGDMLAGVQLSAFYRGRGLAVSVEDLIDRPTKRQQVLLFGGF